MKLALLLALTVSLSCAMTLGKVTPIKVGEEIGYECKGLGFSWGKASACGTVSEHIGEEASSLIRGVLCAFANAYRPGACGLSAEDSDD